jgi:hypothetical protein
MDILYQAYLGSFGDIIIASLEIEIRAECGAREQPPLCKPYLTVHYMYGGARSTWFLIFISSDGAAINTQAQVAAWRLRAPLPIYHHTDSKHTPQ